MNKVFFGKANTSDVVTRCSYIHEDKEWFNGIDVGDYIFIKLKGESTSEGAVVNYLFRAKSWNTVTEGFELKLEKIAALNNGLPLQKFIALDIFCLNTNLLNFTFKQTKGCIAPLEVVNGAVNVLETQEKWEKYYATEPVRKICVLDKIDKAIPGTKDIQIIVDKRTVQLYRSDFIPDETYENFDKNALLRIAPGKGSSKKKMYDALQNGVQAYSWKELSLLAFYDFFITQVETKRKDFIEYCKTHGVPTAYNQYESAIRTMEKLLSVNADEEYESDACNNMLNRARTLPEAKTQDFPSKLKKFIEYKYAIYNNDEQENSSQERAFSMNVENNPENKIASNTILYGPPGTGKTYNTVIYAVAICNPNDPDKTLEKLKKQAKNKSGYDAICEEYTKLVADGRIAFTTFHQSYGYEEFVEGIKPKMDEKKQLYYDVKAGCFKEFCDNASIKLVDKDSTISSNITVWKTTIQKSVIKDCFENNRVRIGWDIEDAGANGFVKDMKIGDIILTTDGSRTKINGIATIKSEVYSLESENDPTTRDVDWISTDINLDISEFNNGKMLHRMTVARVPNVDAIKILSIKENFSTFNVEKNKDPYVFIIDEINRGNVSKIFGELITLIEDSKRSGRKEAMEVVLPYSGDRFSVPENVYILGTMNTADRSLALMDTALRRRFDFVEMMPDADLFEGITVKNEDNGAEVKIDALLKTINKRIEYLYDREHTIGHAYFKELLQEENRDMPTLRKIFIKKIIPLLQEYFYDDYERIRLVLGDNRTDLNGECFIQECADMDKLFFGNEEIDRESKIYSVNEDIKKFSAERFKKIYE